MRRERKKLMALLLTVALLIPQITTYVFAEESNGPVPEIGENQQIEFVAGKEPIESREGKLESQPEEQQPSPEVKEPETQKPEVKEPETEKPGVKEPETEKPEVKEPETEKTEVKEPEEILPEIGGAIFKDEFEFSEGFSNGALFLAAPKAGENFPHKFDQREAPENPISHDTGENIWQIMKGKYWGHTKINDPDATKAYDRDAYVSYSGDNAVRMTKSVINSDIENEFTMYLNIEPQVSWADIMRFNKIGVSNNAGSIGDDGYPGGGGATKEFYPVPTGSAKTPLDFEYYVETGGKREIIATVTMYAVTNKVPNGSIGIGNLLLQPDGRPFHYVAKFSIRPAANGKNPTLEIDMTEPYKKYEFPKERPSIQNVQDNMGDYVKTHGYVANYDGGIARAGEKFITWTLPTEDLGEVPYEIVNGMYKMKAISRILPNGKLTAYFPRAYQLTYDFFLDVTEPGFPSAYRTNSDNSITNDYAIQTNKSPDDSTRGGTVYYTLDGKSLTGDFNSPYIKGLLYDVEFRKVVEKTKIPLEGVKFKIKRISGEGNYSNVEPKEEVTDEYGWIKFHDLPWGTYEITEVSFKEGDIFQNNYLDEELPKVLGTDGLDKRYFIEGDCKVGEVLEILKRKRNPDEKYRLHEDHAGAHSVDKEKDLRNRLYIYNEENPLRAGYVENEPYYATVKIKKNVKYFNQMAEYLKDKAYTIKTKNENENPRMPVYWYPYPPKKNTLNYWEPEGGDASNDGKWTEEEFNKSVDLKHRKRKFYKLILPKTGGEISIKEIIPEEIRNNMELYDVTVEPNEENKGEYEFYEKEEGEYRLKLQDENNLTVTVKNRPVSKVRVQKYIDNYDTYDQKLKDDEFMIRVDGVSTVTDDETKATTSENFAVESVLKHKEISGYLKLTDPTVLSAKEIIPMEYKLSSMSLVKSEPGKEDQVSPTNGQDINIELGYDYKFIFYNEYEWKPFFHTFDSLMNEFKRIVGKGDE